jgi:hypothetical protein
MRHLSNGQGRSSETCQFAATIEYSNLEALYGHRCRTPLNWVEPGERKTFGPDLVMEVEEIVHHIQFSLKVSMSRQEHYVNKRCHPLTFIFGYHVYLHVSPMRGVKSFGIKGKLAPRYIAMFPILGKLGTVACKLELPPSLVGVHDVFHISQIKKCLKATADVIVNDVAPLMADQSYPDHPAKMLGQQDQVMRRRTICFYKVQWSHHSKEEATWETKDFLYSNYLDFLPLERRICNLSFVTPSVFLTSVQYFF